MRPLVPVDEVPGDAGVPVPDGMLPPLAPVVELLPLGLAPVAPPPEPPPPAPPPPDWAKAMPALAASKAAARRVSVFLACMARLL
jgi:hypothetical protein